MSQWNIALKFYACTRTFFNSSKIVILFILSWWLRKAICCLGSFSVQAITIWSGRWNFRFHFSFSRVAYSCIKFSLIETFLQLSPDLLSSPLLFERDEHVMRWIITKELTQSSEVAKVFFCSSAGIFKVNEYSTHTSSSITTIRNELILKNKLHLAVWQDIYGLWIVKRFVYRPRRPC